MPFERDDLDLVQERLLKLERDNRRIKQIGGAVMVALALLLLTAQAPQTTKSPLKSVEANEFVLKDSNGRVRARMSVSNGGPGETSLVFMDDKGQKKTFHAGKTWPERFGSNGQFRKGARRLHRN
jgi:hypothetical protein